jgi:outer membrane protein OmpA-like peptidoglycan-associated protein
MKSDKSNSFWPSYTDLMTSLFFIMLVLFVLVFAKQQQQIKDLERVLAVVNAVDENLKPLKNDTALFIYEKEYRRFKLSFDVKFQKDRFSIDNNGLFNYDNTKINILKAGLKLQSVIKQLKLAKDNDESKKNISYILVIAGYASNDGTDEYHNYELSYKRAYYLKKYWENVGIDFEAPEFNSLIDLQISGNGWGGVGRVPFENEEANQRFLIQIFPKIGDIKK